MFIALVSRLLVLSAPSSAGAFSTVRSGKSFPALLLRTSNVLLSSRRADAFDPTGTTSTPNMRVVDSAAAMATKPTTTTAARAGGDAARLPRRPRSRGIPKEETGVRALLARDPGADGRGVKIAIMDTGCDLRAAGLAGTTSDGVTPKYLDFLDCTGDGDVRMDKTVAFDAAASRTVAGLSGRDLTVGDWAEGVTEFRLGAVRLYDLLPRGVERRLKNQRKEAFLTKHMALISETQKSLDSLPSDKDGSKDGSKDESKDVSKDGASGGDDKDAAGGKKSGAEKKELELLLEQLQAITESHQDFSPLMDCLLFKGEGEEGEEGVWQAVIDVEANGDLADSVPMAPFGHARQTGELAFGSEVTFCVQVYDDGHVLNLVTDAGSHGTHVAGITAAYFAPAAGEAERREDLNGAAPGAQILACKIGDGRLGSAETGTGLVRALIAAKKYGCDLINLSYGEPSWQPDSGRVAQVFSDAVHKWGMAVFTSAGNDGPALSSLGSPGSLSAPITVGAFVSPEMMAEQYSTLPRSEADTPLQGASYYFSSRGPTPDGLLPDICAPGGAISPVPRHSLQGKAQYHGTSMSSPNACGVAACILSAVRQKGVAGPGPVELKRALMNTARNPDGVVEPFAQGAGLVSAPDCVDYILAHHGKVGQNLALDVSLPARNRARGIYIRDEAELDGPMTFGVMVTPRFEHSNQRTAEEMDELLSLELDLALTASDSWVTCPESMRLLSAKERNGQSFSVRLNTEGLPPGVHFATVGATDAADPKRGNMFSLPITVIVPHSKFVSPAKPMFKLNEKEHVSLKDNGLDISTTFDLEQGVANRRFVTVPRGAEWCTIKVKGSELTTNGTAPLVYLHAIPFVGGDLPNTETQMKKIYRMKEGVEEEYHMRVKGGSALELCLQLLWLADPSPASVTADIEFHSLDARVPTMVSSQPITITPAGEFARLGAGTPLRAEQLNPLCTLTAVRRTLRPEDSDIKLGSTELDVLPPSDAEVRASNGKQAATALGTHMYEMRLHYKFAIKGDKEIKARPSFPSLFHQIYDSPLDSQLWALEDSNSQILQYGGAIHHSSPVALKKGDYRISLLLKHANRNVLEKMQNIPCEVSLTLADPLTCSVYGELDKASTPAVKDDGRSPLKSMLLRKGSHQDIYVARPAEDLPDWITSGDVLEGSLVLDKNKKSVTSMELLYVAPPKPIKKDSKKEKSDSEDKPDSLEDVVFKAKLDHMAGLRTKNATLYKEHAAALTEEKPTSVPLLSELLLFALEGPVPSDTDEDTWRLKEVQLVIDAMQNSNNGPIDLIALAQYFGLNEPDKDELDDDEEAKTLHKEMKEQRKAYKKALLARADLGGKIADNNSSLVDEFDLAVKELKKWVSTATLDDDKEKIKHSITLAKHARICQNRNATAVSILLKAKKDLSGKELEQVEDELMKAYGMLDGAKHLRDCLKEEIQNRFPVVKRSV